VTGPLLQVALAEPVHLVTAALFAEDLVVVLPVLLLIAGAVYRLSRQNRFRMNLDDRKIDEYQPYLAGVDVLLAEARLDVLPEGAAHWTLVVTELDDGHFGGGSAEHVRIGGLGWRRLRRQSRREERSRTRTPIASPQFRITSVPSQSCRRTVRE